MTRDPCSFDLFYSRFRVWAQTWGGKDVWMRCRMKGADRGQHRILSVRARVVRRKRVGFLRVVLRKSISTWWRDETSLISPSVESRAMGDWEKQVMRCISYQSFSYQSSWATQYVHIITITITILEILILYIHWVREWMGKIEKTTVKEIEIWGRGGQFGVTGAVLGMVVIACCGRREDGNIG